MFQENEHPNTAAHYALAFLRIALGAWLIWAAIPKLSSDFFEGGFLHKIQFFLSEGAIDFYKPVLHGVIAQVHLFVLLVAFGELLLGIALVLGLFTRTAAWLTILMCANYLLATFHLGPASLGVNLFCILIALALIFGRAGEVFALDRSVKYRKRHVIEA